MASFSFSNPEQRKIVFGIGAGIGLLVWFALFLVPQVSSWFVTRAKVADLARKIAETQRGLVKLPETEKEIARLRAQYELPAVTPPPEQQLPELLEMIAQAAKSSQVNLVSVKPKANLRELAPGATGYLELPLQLDAVGGYHQVGKFLDVLENSQSLVRVQQIQIKQSPEEMWRHSATLVLTAYLLPAGEAKQSKEAPRDAR